MAITKILARNARLDAAINYVINGDKTDEHILTAYLNCDPGHAYQQMLETKQEIGKTGGRQCYHIIQSFLPGEVTPELALEIAREFAEECLPGYEVVIGTHVDKHHIHSHLVFNSVNTMTGEKYHIRTADYYKQIRAVSDRLCREHGLSVIMQGESGKAVSYVEWLRQSKGQPTFRSMLEADLRAAIEDANDLGHFYLLMEHMGYEIHHGNRLGFRLRGQERFMYPERKNPLFSEEGIRAAIQGNLEEIEAGKRPAVVYRPPYRAYKPYRKYKGFLALYVHYLYVLGKIEHREYPPRMTPELKASVMRFEQYRAQFAFLRENSITTKAEILVSTAVRLAPFNLPQIKAITDHDDMNLYTLGEKKVALYAVIPDNDNTFNFLVSLLYAQAFQTLYYSADQIHHGELPCHVHFVLDEFAAMPLPGFTRELATMRSRNISASTIIQNMAQIKELYKDSWETIPGNSDTLLYLGGNEASTHKVRT